jgi:hypothetical protein
MSAPCALLPSWRFELLQVEKEKEVLQDGSVYARL